MGFLRGGGERGYEGSDVGKRGGGDAFSLTQLHSLGSPLQHLESLKVSKKFFTFVFIQ